MSRKFVLVGLVVMAMALAACGAEGLSEEPAADEEPIVIGASLPLSGRFEEPGTAAGNGYEVWAAIVNDSGGLLGRPVEIRILDNESEQEIAAAQYEELITVDQVDLVVGPFSSFLVIPTSAVAAEHGYAFVEPAGGAPEVFDRGLDNIFFAQPAPAARQGDPFAEYILGLPADERPETFAVVSLDDPFTLGVAERLTGLLEDGGLELVYEATYTADTTDFSEMAAEVAEAAPDLIVGGTLLEDSIGQVTAYNEIGFDPQYEFYTMGPTVPGPFKDALGDNTEGVFSGISWFPEANDYQNAEFTQTYIEMFGGSLGDIPEDAANAFTVGQVLQQAVESVGSIDNAALIEELHNGTYDTIVGPLNFDDRGAPEGSVMLLQWQGANFLIVGPSGRAEADPLPPSYR